MSSKTSNRPANAAGAPAAGVPEKKARRGASASSGERRWIVPEVAPPTSFRSADTVRTAGVPPSSAIVILAGFQLQAADLDRQRLAAELGGPRYEGAGDTPGAHPLESAAEEVAGRGTLDGELLDRHHLDRRQTFDRLDPQPAEGQPAQAELPQLTELDLCLEGTGQDPFDDRSRLISRQPERGSGEQQNGDQEIADPGLALPGAFDSHPEILMRPSGHDARRRCKIYRNNRVT